VKGRLYVSAQAVLIAALVLAPRWADAWSVSAPVTIAGWCVAALGVGLLAVAFPQLGRALSPLPEPRADGELTTSGLYRWVRHPIYSGVLAMAWGWTLAHLSWLTVVVAVALTLLLNAKARYEEGLLSERYPDYAAYSRHTPRFVARPWRRSERA
jgi:protein-S-isoprenylcysteine O-methyltransferase Ste14